MTHWMLRFERCGPARYLSHLDTARALQRCFARAGIQLALSEGFRPKVRFSLPLALPVGAAGLDELAVVEVVDEAPAPADALRALRAAAPPGIAPFALVAVAVRPHPRPSLAHYECDIHGDAGTLCATAEWFAQQSDVTIERVSPKGRRTLDLKRFVQDLVAQPVPGGVRLTFAVRHRGDGAARPQEVVDLLAARAGCGPVMHRLTRTSVSFEGLPRGTEPGGEE